MPMQVQPLVRLSGIADEAGSPTRPEVDDKQVAKAAQAFRQGKVSGETVNSLSMAERPFSTETAANIGRGFTVLDPRDIETGILITESRAFEEELAQESPAMQDLVYNAISYMRDLNSATNTSDSHVALFSAVRASQKERGAKFFDYPSEKPDAVAMIESEFGTASSLIVKGIGTFVGKLVLQDDKI